MLSGVMEKKNEGAICNILVFAGERWAEWILAGAEHNEGKKEILLKAENYCFDVRKTFSSFLSLLAGIRMYDKFGISPKEEGLYQKYYQKDVILVDCGTGEFSLKSLHDCFVDYEDPGKFAKPIFLMKRDYERKSFSILKLEGLSHDYEPLKEEGEFTDFLEKSFSMKFETQKAP